MAESVAPAWFTDAIAAPFEHRRLAVTGCDLSYLVWGDPARPPLVLVHGGAAHAMWWSLHAAALARHYYVIAPDLSGHGDSGRRETYPMETWADEVLAISEHESPGRRPVLVGHSMGGLVSIVAAAVYGRDRLAGAIIVDSPVRKPDPESEEGKSGRSFRNPKTYPDRETAMAHFRLVPEQPCEHGFILEHIARHSLRQTADGWTWKFDPRVFLRFRKGSMRDYLAGVRCRVALMRGEFSTIVPPETGEYMVELLNRNSPLVEIPQAHHHLILDQPLAFIAALRALLADWEHSEPHPHRPAGS
jgi:pimeloyl-ACP methyl ester carboxylesterase